MITELFIIYHEVLIKEIPNYLSFLKWEFCLEDEKGE